MADPAAAVERPDLPREAASSAVVRVAPEREWDGLRQVVDDVRERLARYRECEGAEEVLARVWAAHAALERLEHTVQSAHLACCVLPCLATPDELAVALARLSAARVGALVVIEQEQNLDDYAARGTPLDAQARRRPLRPAAGRRLRSGGELPRRRRVVDRLHRLRPPGFQPRVVNVFFAPAADRQASVRAIFDATDIASARCRA
ncbi:MAG TPA: hypothetical protein VNO26_13240 [Candidatus Limnocylindria bacterium]|nr:hypothetical protein [Candidatus Limnocylindria bacterium]